MVEIKCIINQIVFMKVLSLRPPFYHPLEFLFKTLSDKHEDICWTSFSHAHTHTRARIESY